MNDAPSRLLYHSNNAIPVAVGESVGNNVRAAREKEEIARMTSAILPSLCGLVEEGGYELMTRRLVG